MERILRFSIRIAILMLFVQSSIYGQTTVFSDDFTASAGTAFSTATGPVGTSTKWNLTRSGADFGARINGGNLTLTNDAGGTANASGWVMAAANTATFTTPYNTILASNPGVVTWTFNMRQNNTNPAGFGTSGSGVAYILAGSAGTTNVSGTGYAVVLGNSGTSIDPLKLVRYTSGLRTATTMITSNTSGLTDFGNQYLSVKVTFTPSTNTWQLFVRNDGTSAFQDPASGSLTSQGTIVNNTYTGSAMPISGAILNVTYVLFGTANQTAFFDNVAVTVAIPTTTSIAPSSKIAGTGVFILTVNGTNFVNGVSTVRWNGVNRTTTYVSPTQLTASIPASDLITSGTASITVANGAAVSNAQIFTIDPAGLPTLTLSTSGLTNLSTIAGTASPALTYTISGANLTTQPQVAPPANFEVSVNGTAYFNSLTLPITGNVITGQPVTLYARLKAVAPAGIYSGTIDHTVTGGTTKQVAVSGTVLATQPVTQASALNFTAVTSASFTVNWTNGSGSNRLVVVRASTAVNAAPVDALSYTPSIAFGAGSELGTSNFVVYSGSGNSVNVTGLSPASTYHVAVYEFNGSGGTENYFSTTPALGNRTTLNAPIGWQIQSANAVNTINFDTTVDGVNLNAFQGDGFSTNSEAGELNSNAWAVTGFTDGAIAFGGTYTEDQDFDRRASEGGVTEGGIYAFETSPDNFSLGVQPATGDFAPGSVTLRFQNQTGSPITSLNIGYKVYIYNDEAASSSFNFSYSQDNGTYTNVAGLNVVSPAAADASPNWAASYRVVTLTGLSIPNNTYYYLRWTGAAVSGSVNFDEFALDDIVLVANPTSNFASFGGIAENFAVQGNTSLSANTTVLGDLVLNSGKLDINGKTLTLNGTVTNNTVGGLRGSAASNVTISGAVSPTLSFDQTTPGTTNALNNLTVATTAANTVAISNPVVVNGTLSTAAGQILNLAANALTGTLAIIINNGTIQTQNTSATPLPTGKTWSGTGTVHFNAASAQQTVVAGTYYNLTVSSTGGAVAAGALTVNGILHLPSSNPSATAGSLALGSNVLTMGGNATNTGTGDVTGVVTRNSIVSNTLYTFGQTNTSIIFSSVGTLPTSMSLKIAIGAAPSWRAGAINRTYDFIQTGAVGTKATIKAHYLDSELNGNNEAKLVDWSYIVTPGTVLEQGRSNYNTTDNFVELSNVNAGLYFTGTFNQVLLTLDESEALMLTWNGSVSNSWTTAANWTPNATPSDNTSVLIPNAATTPNDPILNPAVLLGTLTIDAGGILDAPANSQFTINGAGGAWINNGTYNPGTGTSAVIFTNADATIAGTTNFNNITINAGAALRPVTNNIMRISGTFTKTGNLFTGDINNTVEYNGTNQAVVSPNGTLASYHNLIINGTGAVFPTTVGITGDLTLNQAINFAGKGIVMKGNDLQTISGTVTQDFNDLTINNTLANVNLTANANVNGTLTLTAGNLNIGNNILLLGANAVAGTFSPSAMIVAGTTGEVRRTFTATGAYTFPIGETTGTKEYSPITVFINSGAFSNAYVGVSVVDTVHPNNSSSDNNISRYWNISQSGITGAVATITANYLPADITGAENSISAAQLTGAFNQQTNPWVKYTALGSNTLSVVAAPLASGQVAAFTGIKGSAFTVLLSGYGSFCQNQVVTLTATPSEGDGPYTYQWSGGLGTAETATPPTNAVGTTNYVVTVRDNNGITATDNNNVVVLPPSSGGTLSPYQEICSGTVPTDITLTGNVGTITHWQSSPDLNFLSPANISNTTNILTGLSIGPVTTTIYFRAVVQNGSCAEVYSTPVGIVIKSTTWNGTAWSDGAPDAATTAFVTGAYTVSSNFNACTLTVSNNAAVTVLSGFDVTLNGALTVNAGSTFTLQNNANLLQVTNAANAGNIIVKRNSSALKRQDYTLWSSPVDGQNLLAFSPLTVVSPTSRFYNYNTATNFYSSILSPSTTNFETGAGYLIRMPNNHPSVTPTIWAGQFTGVPHNGDVNLTLVNNGAGQRFNLVGNPYPSPIDMNEFVSDNSANITGTLYFWRKTNNELSPSYCSWSTAGFVDNGEAQVFNPQGILQTAQGFLVEAAGNATALQFNNSQRVGDNAGQFFREQLLERHRIWLNATNVSGAYSQMLVGYMTGATQGVDFGIDGKYNNDGPIALNSLIDNVEYVIQGRPVPFDVADVVPLRFTTSDAGTYQIAIDHLDGIFLDEQGVYLRDNLLGIIHDLKSGAYVFSYDEGVTDGRFDLVYQPSASLGTDAPAFDENSVIIYKQDGSFVVNSGRIIMDHIQVYDIRGRLLANHKNINAAETTVNAGEANQVLIFKIVSEANQEVTKKVVN